MATIMGNYYRYRPSLGFGGFTLTPAVKYLLIINAGLFVIPEILGLRLPGLLLLALVPGWVVRGMVWQVFTYMFFHGGFSHFLFNMLTLWMFGTAVEQTWGTRRFARYYLSCGLAAGVTVVLVALLAGTREALFTPTIGSSGAIFGLILAFGMLFPEAPVLVMFIFPMPAKYFAILMGFIEFFLQRTQPGSGISHVAHLGGMAFGFLYIRYYLRRRRRSPLASYYSDRSSARRSGLFSRFDLPGAFKRWKLRRARRKFEVYMRQQEQDRDREGPGRWVN